MLLQALTVYSAQQGDNKQAQEPSIVLLCISLHVMCDTMSVCESHIMKMPSSDKNQ